MQFYVCVLVAQSCPTLWDPMDCNPRGSSLHGILQARILEWVAIPSPGDLPDPGSNPGLPVLQASSLLKSTMKPQNMQYRTLNKKLPAGKFMNACECYRNSGN